MQRATPVLGLLVAALALLPLATSAQEAAREPIPEPTAVVQRVESALRTQAATRDRLRVLGDAFACDVARLVSYRRSSSEPEVSDQWYVVSQLWADAALLSLSGPASPPLEDLAETRCHVEKGLIYLDRLWDYDLGGYYPRSNPTGVFVERGPRFADDNGLAGLLFVELAAAVPPDSSAHARYVHAARREADLLIGGGLWDNTFGGGFWWNTSKGNTAEGKPAQTNAIAALFLGRLHQLTGDPLYREWALRTLLWMDTFLFDSSASLYRWNIAYSDPERHGGPPLLSHRYFNYDQGIAIEAQMVAARLDGDPARVPRAGAVGRALHHRFWNQDRGGYNLEAGIEQVFTSYAAWTSLGHLALYDLDRDPAWLEMALANHSALALALREPDDGYAYLHYRCVDTFAPGCESGMVRNVVDRTRDTTAQAWPQHLELALARSPAAFAEKDTSATGAAGDAE